MFNLILSDYRKYFLISGFGKLGICEKLKFLIPLYGFQSIVIYRYGHWIETLRSSNLFLKISSSPLILIYLVFNFFIKKAYDIEIDRNAIIGKNFYIGHFGGIRIPACKIGDNCSINQRVVIESSIQDKSTHIGNNVWIGAHSVIKAGVCLNNKVTVAAGSVVLNNVSENYLIAGNPARALNINYDNSALLGFSLDDF